jgi:hypothetical protein
MFNNNDPQSSSSSHDGLGRQTTSVHSNGPYEAAAPPSSASQQATINETAAGYAVYEFRRVLAKIDQATSDQALFWVANSAFGPNNFCNRFGEALYSANRLSLPLQKLMMQAELEDHLNGRTDWPPCGNRSLGFGGPELWEVGRHLRRTRINLLNDKNPLKKAVETRDALLVELNALFSQPSPVFNELRAKLDSQAYDHWVRYLEKVTLADGQSAAGWSLGMVLASVLDVIASLVKREALSANLTESLPSLSSFASTPKP